MKKVFLALALVAIYVVAISNVSTNEVTIEKSKVTVVANDDNSAMTVEEDEKDKKKKTTKTTATSEKSKTKTTGCSETQKNSCAASGKTCGETKTTTARKSCCGEKK